MDFKDIKKTLDYAGRNGIRAAVAAARERLEDRRIPYTYEAPDAGSLTQQRKEMQEEMRAGRAPRISVVVPCWETPEAYLSAMKASVEAQSFPAHELVLSEEPGGISVNTNAAIDRATGDYIALLDHDDVLSPDALYHMATAVREAAETGVKPALIYSDEDKVSESADGTCTYFAPHRKPDANYDYLLSNNYICHFAMVESTLLKRLKLRPAFDGAQDHDLFLRIFSALLDEAGGDARAADARILHVPRVLYHWRASASSTAESGANKTWAHGASKRAVAAHLEERGIRAAVEELPHRGFVRVHYFDDIFQARPDVGAVAGKLTDARGRMMGGLYDADGSILFDGLPKGYSGGFHHRAVCQQDAAAADITNMRIRPELLEEFPAPLRAVISMSAAETVNRPLRIERSLMVSEEIKKRGYRILWDPRMEKRIEP